MATTKQSRNVSFSSVIASYASRHDVDTTKAGKAVRSKIRNLAANDDAAVTKWLAAAGKENRDGNRYPKAMPRTLAKRLV